MKGKDDKEENMQSGVGGLQALFLFLFLFERQREEDWSTDNSICWFAVQEPARALNHELGMPRVWMDGPQLDGPPCFSRACVRGNLEVRSWSREPRKPEVSLAAGHPREEGRCRGLHRAKCRRHVEETAGSVGWTSEADRGNCGHRPKHQNRLA